MTDDPLVRAIRAILGARPTPTQRRLLAIDLRALAERQEAIADADERSGVRVRAMLDREQGNADRPKGGRPRGGGGRFVRIETPTHRSAVVHLAPALYQELGSPDRVSIVRADRQLIITPASPAAGYHVTLPAGARGGMPRISIGRTQAADLGLQAGRHTARIDAGRIVWS